MQGGPLEHVITAKAVAFGEAMTPEFKAYARQVVQNAQALAQALVERGYAIVSGGTDTHLMLVDLRPKQVTGKEAQELLDRAGITVNKNTIPGDPQKAFVTSGIRIGTPAVTTRGFTETEMHTVATLIDTVLTKQDDSTIARVKADVRELTEQFPLYAAPARATAAAFPACPSRWTPKASARPTSRAFSKCGSPSCRPVCRGHSRSGCSKWIVCQSCRWGGWSSIRTSCCRWRSPTRTPCSSSTRWCRATSGCCSAW